jgi:CRISPR/Cas system CMR-associated protein Cmr5 small subunit
MAINNLEQKRLLYAMNEAKGKNKDYGNMVKKVPTYIQKNGFPYTMAFLQGEKNGKPIFETIYKWHTNKDKNAMCLVSSVSNENAFVEEILRANGDLLRALTLETFSLMKSLRRFAKSDGDDTEE